MSNPEYGVPKPEDVHVSEASYEKREGVVLEAEHTKSLEELESERVANEKLTLLLGDDCTEFAIRYVNIDEYLKLTTEGELPTREVIVYNAKTTGGGYNFKQFLEDGPTSQSRNSRRIGWATQITESTDWPHATANISSYDLMLRFLKEARIEIPNGTDERNPAVLRAFREKLLAASPVDKEIQAGGSMGLWYADMLKIIEYVQEEYEYDIDGLKDAENELSKIIGSENAAQLLKNLDSKMRDSRSFSWRFNISPAEQDRILATVSDEETRKEIVKLVDNIGYLKSQMSLFSEDSLRVIHDFLTTDTFEHTSLREVIHAIAYARLGKDRDSAQYHIAMVFNTAGIYGLEHAWANLDQRMIKLNNLTPSQCILGAIALMPNKELWETMITADAQAQDASHPIFDRNGVVRYPSE